MILQRNRLIVGDVGFEPGISAPEVRSATTEPPHLLVYLLHKKKLKFYESTLETKRFGL